jgi:hypothetical protein
MNAFEYKLVPCDSEGRLDGELARGVDPILRTRDKLSVGDLILGGRYEVVDVSRVMLYVQKRSAS